MNFEEGNGKIILDKLLKLGNLLARNTAAAKTHKEFKSRLVDLNDVEKLLELIGGTQYHPSKNVLIRMNELYRKHRSIESKEKK